MSWATACKKSTSRSAKVLKVSLWAIGLLVVCLALWAGVKRASCAFYGWSMEREVQYKPFVGCAVKTSNGYVLRSELRSVAN